jgi:hypothetical protein
MTLMTMMRMRTSLTRRPWQGLVQVALGLWEHLLVTASSHTAGRGTPYTSQQGTRVTQVVNLEEGLGIFMAAQLVVRQGMPQLGWRQVARRESVGQGQGVGLVG